MSTEGKTGFSIEIDIPLPYFAGDQLKLVC